MAILLALALLAIAGDLPADAGAEPGGKFAAPRLGAGPVGLSCARSGHSAGRVSVDVQVSYSDLRPQLASWHGRGALRLTLLTRGGRVLARTRDAERLRPGVHGTRIYNGQRVVLGPKASGRVLRYAHDRGRCVAVPRRDRLVRLKIVAREEAWPPGRRHRRSSAGATKSARIWAGTRVATVAGDLPLACPPYPCLSTAAAVLAWKPSDARPFDRATVPLAPRPPVTGPRMLVGVDDGEWTYWSDFDLNAQGSARSGNVYDFSQWQYVDTFYYYAHSLLSVPPTVWTNAAHRSGVPVLGTVTGDCGGCPGELNALFEDHPTEAVSQLRALAATYGFDGWVIDIENGAKYSPQLLAAMEALRTGGPNREATPLRVVTYEAQSYSLPEGRLKEGMRKPFEAAGEVQADYTTSTEGEFPRRTYDFLNGQSPPQVDRRYDYAWSSYVYQYTADKTACGGKSGPNWIFNGLACNDAKALFENLGSARASTDPPGFYTSLSLYAPDWTIFAPRTYVTEPPPARELIHAAAERLWAGEGGYRLNGGQCRLANPDQYSVSGLLAPRPTLTSTPFLTRFDSGEGDRFFVEGRPVGKNWNMLSAQDTLPNEVCTEGSDLSAKVDYATAYDGGSSLQVSGTAYPSDHRLYLYEASAPLPAQPGFVLRYLTAGKGTPYVVVWIDGKGPYELLPTIKVNSGTWTYTRAVLPPNVPAGTLTRIGVGFSSIGPTPVNTRIGELAVVDLATYKAPLQIAPTVAPGSLSWTPPALTPRFYNVWAIAGGASCASFVGRTVMPRYDLVHPLFAIPSQPRFLVQPVSENGVAASLSTPSC